MANQKVLKKSSNKHWNYEQGHMKLSFDIDVQVKTDMKDFLDLLKAAVIDLENEIKEYKAS